MHSPFILAVAVAAVFASAVAIAFVIWQLKFPPIPPAVPPAGAAAPALTAPSHGNAFDDEWEAQAPYPDHALHAIRPDEPMSQRASSFDARSRSRDRFEFDDVESFERDGSSHFRQPDQQTKAGPDFFSFAPPDATDSLTLAPGDASAYCPHCHSTRIETLNVARKAGGTIGSVAGATGGMAMALSGAEAGAAVGAIGGPIGSIFGGLAGAVIAGLVGSAAGCAAGSAVGAAIDDNILDNYRCRTCGHAFGAQQG
ncbi:hypothetical protein [Burkholderia sp. B21-007]|uniref:hypothetical protein n=1 Tax=Burkholderia sp. B21-007 TaxID=2890407 RepID=UPI001E6533EB|nr:hypothetical protein [Burkholderia sp. B21-007]UEP28012.1 hypothetical protein LMA01_00835 [Burkholderia sp. B21-007]